MASWRATVQTFVELVSVFCMGGGALALLLETAYALAFRPSWAGETALTCFPDARALWIALVPVTCGLTLGIRRRSVRILAWSGLVVPLVVLAVWYSWATRELVEQASRLVEGDGIVWWELRLWTWQIGLVIPCGGLVAYFAARSKLREVAATS